jgi:hypothetical protein
VKIHEVYLNLDTYRAAAVQALLADAAPSVRRGGGSRTTLLVYDVYKVNNERKDVVLAEGFFASFEENRR